MVVHNQWCRNLSSSWTSLSGKYELMRWPSAYWATSSGIAMYVLFVSTHPLSPLPVRIRLQSSLGTGRGFLASPSSATIAGGLFERSVQSRGRAVGVLLTLLVVVVELREYGNGHAEGRRTVRHVVARAQEQDRGEDNDRPDHGHARYQCISRCRNCAENSARRELTTAARER